MSLRKRIINRENCDPLLKDVIKIHDLTYGLFGRYAYEWKISIEFPDGSKRVIQFKNNKTAREEWRKIQKLKKQQV